MSNLEALLAMSRRQAGLSQLELALRLGYSARHIGFVERGRARPGRNLVIDWLAETGASSLRSAALSLAGYTPDPPIPRPEAKFWSVESASRSTLGRLLAAHEPFPAFVMDCDWRIISANASFSRILAVVCPETSAAGLDMVAFLSGGCGEASVFANAEALRDELVLRLRAERWWNPALEPALQRLEEARTDDRPWETDGRMVLDLGSDRLSFERFQLVNGAPGEITSSFCRAELWYPADDDTRRALADLQIAAPPET
jgi:transcriptional regulator with XRE-family HTH domain